MVDSGRQWQKSGKNSDKKKFSDGSIQNQPMTMRKRDYAKAWVGWYAKYSAILGIVAQWHSGIVVISSCLLQRLRLWFVAVYPISTTLESAQHSGMPLERHRNVQNDDRYPNKAIQHGAYQTIVTLFWAIGLARYFAIFVEFFQRKTDKICQTVLVG